MNEICKQFHSVREKMDLKYMQHQKANELYPFEMLILDEFQGVSD